MNLLLRDYSPDDLGEIDRIWRKFHKNDFSLPSLRHSIVKGVIEKDSNIIAFGTVVLVPEATLVLNKDCKVTYKVGAIRELLTGALLATKLSGFDCLYASTPDPSFAEILEKHFGFHVRREICLASEV